MSEAGGQINNDTEKKVTTAQSSLQLRVFVSSTSQGMVSVRVDTASWTIAIYPSLRDAVEMRR
jgi:hypothetical protein